MSNYINLPLSGLEEPLSEMEQVVQDIAHRFAEDVLRPVGTQLDEMSADDGVGPDSPLWGALEQGAGLGLSVKAMLDLEPLERTRIMLIAAEELSWAVGASPSPTTAATRWTRAVTSQLPTATTAAPTAWTGHHPSPECEVPTVSHVPQGRGGPCTGTPRRHL